MLVLAVGIVAAKALGIISASIFLFVVSVTVIPNADPESLLAATAAYATVLVALIGGDGAIGSGN